MVNFVRQLHRGPLLVDTTLIAQMGAGVSLYVHCGPNPRPRDVCCKTVSDFIAELNLINYLTPLVYHICKIRTDIWVLEISMLFICRFKVISTEDKKQYINSTKMNVVLFIWIRRLKPDNANLCQSKHKWNWEESMQQLTEHTYPSCSSYVWNTSACFWKHSIKNILNY